MVGLTALGSRLVPKLARLADENDREFFGHLKPNERRLVVRLLEDIVRRNGWKDLPVNKKALSSCKISGNQLRQYCVVGTAECYRLCRFKRSGFASCDTIKASYPLDRSVSVDRVQLRQGNGAIFYPMINCYSGSRSTDGRSLELKLSQTPVHVDC